MHSSYNSEIDSATQLIHQFQFNDAHLILDKIRNKEPIRTKMLESRIFSYQDDYQQALGSLYCFREQPSLIENLELEARKICIHLETGQISAVENSLQRVKNTIETMDTSIQPDKMRILKLKLSIKLSEGILLYHQGKFDSALSFLQDTHSMSVKLTEPYYQILSLYYQSRILRYRTQIDEAEALVKDALHLESQNNYFLLRMKLLNELAMMEWRKGNIEIALKFVDEVLEEVNVSEGLTAETMLTKSAILSDFGDITGAIQISEHSLFIAKAIGRSETAAKIMNNLGSFHLLEGRIEIACDFYHRAIQIYKELGHYIRLPTPLNNLGYIEEQTGNLDRSLNYYNKSLNISKELRRSKSIAETLTNMGMIYFLKDKKEDAFELLNQAYHIREKLKNPIYLSSSHYHLAIVSIHYEEENLFLFHQAKLAGLARIYDNGVIKERHNTITGIMLATAKSFAQRVEGLKLLESIAEDEKSRFHSIALALQTLSTLYIEEYQIFQQKESLYKAEQYISKLYKMCQSENSLLHLVRCIILLAELNEMKKQYKLANKLVVQAHLLAMEKDLPLFIKEAIKVKSRITNKQKESNSEDDNETSMLAVEEDNVMSYLSLLSNLFREKEN